VRSFLCTAPQLPSEARHCLHTEFCGHGRLSRGSLRTRQYLILTQTVGLHAGGCVHCVAEQTVPGHLVAHDARHAGTCTQSSRDSKGRWSVLQCRDGKRLLGDTRGLRQLGTDFMLPCKSYCIKQNTCSIILRSRKTKLPKSDLTVHRTRGCDMKCRPHRTACTRAMWTQTSKLLG
jgi:hypothetical protein